MKTWLKGTQFGMPRYVWLGLITGGVVVGLYLRSRRVEPVEEDAPGYNDTMAYSGEMEGGLVGAGLVGPAPGALTPVQTPFLPEGVTDIFGDLSMLTSDLGAVVRDITTERGETTQNQITGGGPPSVPAAAHSPQPSSCTPGQRMRLASVRTSERAARARLTAVEAQIKRGRAAPNFARNPAMRARVQRLENSRVQLRKRIQALSSERQRLARVCVG